MEVGDILVGASEGRADVLVGKEGGEGIAVPQRTTAENFGALALPQRPEITD